MHHGEVAARNAHACHGFVITSRAEPEHTLRTSDPAAYTQCVRKRSVAMLVIAGTMHFALSTPGAAGPPAGLVEPRLAAVETFALALGVDLDRSRVVERLRAYDLVVLDGETASSSLVSELQSGGTIVLGYLSVGTIERGRSWTGEAKPYRLDHWDDWDEWYADVASPSFRALIADTVAPSILDRGFDGLFLDNVDMISTHPRQANGMVRLVTDLFRITHNQDDMLFAQNGEDVIKPMLGALDGWNREDVSGTYDFDQGRYVEQRPGDKRGAQDALRRLAARGLFVTATDYFAADDTAGAAAATANACAAGARSFVSGIDLARLPVSPPRCPR